METTCKSISKQQKFLSIFLFIFAAFQFLMAILVLFNPVTFILGILYVFYGIVLVEQGLYNIKSANAFLEHTKSNNIDDLNNALMLYSKSLRRRNLLNASYIFMLALSFITLLLII